jgi:hypothetical protein
MIIGQCKIETRIQRNFLCVFYYKRNFGELKAKICLLFNILNEKSGHINLISPAIIEKWISQFADSNQRLVLAETYKILDEYRSMIRKTINKKSVPSLIKSLFKKDPHLERLKEFIGDPELFKTTPKLFAGKLFSLTLKLAETIRLMRNTRLLVNYKK